MYFVYALFTLRSTPESTIVGDFPPSSNVTGVRYFAAAVITILPTWVLPARYILSFCKNDFWKQIHIFLQQGICNNENQSLVYTKSSWAHSSSSLAVTQYDVNTPQEWLTKYDQYGYYINWS